MHWAALDGSQRNEPGRVSGRVSGRILGRVGVWAGLVSGLLGSGCTFNIPARILCDAAVCSGSDQGGPSPDLRPDPNDPNLAGPYQVAVAPITYVSQPALQNSQLYLPSSDGATLSGQMPMYPLVLLAPAEQMDPQMMVAYAQRLASHGIVVALYKPLDDSDQAAYRSVGLGLLNHLLTSLEPVVAGRLDVNRLGLAGYDLGAEMSVAMAAQLPTLRGLFLLDPLDVGGLRNPIDGLQEMKLVKLLNAQPVLIIGEQTSKIGMSGGPPCTGPAVNYEQFYSASTTSTIALNFVNAAHGDFTSVYPHPLCGGGTMTRSDSQSLAIKYLTAYFQWALLDRTTAKMYLTGAAFTADTQKYMLTLMQK